MFGEFPAHGKSSHSVHAKRHIQVDEPVAIVLDERVNDALNDLSAYALTLEAEHERLAHRLLELAENESSAAERRAVVRERNEIGEELTAFRQAVTALRDQVLRRPPALG